MFSSYNVYMLKASRLKVNLYTWGRGVFPRSPDAIRRIDGVLDVLVITLFLKNNTLKLSAMVNSDVDGCKVTFVSAKV